MSHHGLPLLLILCLLVALSPGVARADFDGSSPSTLRPGPDGNPPPPLREHAHEISACYEPALARHPRLSVRAVLTIIVDEDGAVVDANVPIPEDAVLEDCLEGSARGWRFPPFRPPPGFPHPAAPFQLALPLDLSPTRN